jgi:carboxymethylenebutenolidase
MFSELRTTALGAMPVRNLPMLLVAAIIVGSCQGGAEREAPGGEGEPASHDTGLTGAVSEDAFKALHELKGEAAPPARGSEIELAGTRAYLSLPEAGEAPYPGLVVIHEWWGLNDNIRHWSDRLAAEGYAALAVDLYGGRVADNSDSAMAYMKSVDDEKALSIMQAGLSFLASDDRVQAARRGSIGWCFGGGMSLNLALAEPGLDAAVIYYGRLNTDPEELAAIQAKLIGIFANQDEGIPPAVVNEFEAALKEAGVSYEIHRYDANHAFANPSSARYDEEAAAAAWEKVRAFLARTLKS